MVKGDERVKSRGARKADDRTEDIFDLRAGMRTAPCVPVFVKQLQLDGKLVRCHFDFPDDLKIRQFPLSEEVTAQ